MKPHYQIALVPREIGGAAVVARFKIEMELTLGPELRGSLENAIQRVTDPDYAPGGFHKNPFGPDFVPVRIDEIAKALLRALTIAETIQNLPDGSELELLSKPVEDNMSFLDFAALDGALRNTLSVRLVGDVRMYPCSLIFTSGLTTWTLTANSREQAAEIMTNLQSLAASFSDVASKNYVADPASRATAEGVTLHGWRCINEFFDACERARKEHEANPGNRQKILDGLMNDTRGCREPGFREGESGGFRRDGGFVK